MTGAPKISAIDHIAALEPVGRGASMGALGTIHPNGDLDLALTIRTFAIAEGRIHLWVGGGIVWDSDPAEEIEESGSRRGRCCELSAHRSPELGARMTLLALAVSGRGLVRPDEPVIHVDDEAFMRGRGAFESLRVYDGKPFRLAEHLERLGGSCARLGFELSPRTSSRSWPELALDDARAAEAVLRVYATPGRGDGPIALVVVSELPPDLDELRARGIRAIRRVPSRPTSSVA